MFSPAYFLTNDELNASYARQRAFALHQIVSVLGLRDTLPPAGTLIIDWDHLPVDVQQWVLGLGVVGSLSVIVATYGDEEIGPMLRARGINVFHTLDQAFESLRSLASAA